MVDFPLVEIWVLVSAGELDGVPAGQRGEPASAVAGVVGWAVSLCGQAADKHDPRTMSFAVTTAM